jgi:beta-glucosidase
MRGVLRCAPMGEERFATAPGEPAQISILDRDLSDDDRIDAIVRELTRDEKITCLGTIPTLPRLGIRASGHVEGLHGLALGGPGQWGGDHPVPTTTFPQAIGLAETWAPDLVRAVAEVEADEARYYFHHPSHRRGGLVVRAPNADLGRDPRWGRIEECYGEDPFLCGTMATEFVRGLQGDHPRFWRAAALLKHFFANSNEDGRERSSSDFEERLFHEYYAAPFRMAIEAGGARAFMAAYNAHNGVPCAVHPWLRSVAVEEWGQDGILCTDGGGLGLLVSAHQAFPDREQAVAATLRAGITQYLDRYRDAVAGALEQGLVQEADLEPAIRANLRVMLRLGLLHPEREVPFAQIPEGAPEPWREPARQALVRRITRKSAVLLRNRGGLLPLDAASLRSIAVVGPLADRVLLDWYSGTPPYLVSPLAGIQAHVGARVEVVAATNNDVSAAVRAARLADVAVVCVGNHPTGDAGWGAVTRPGDGKEAIDRQSLELFDATLVRKVLDANPRTVVVLLASFPYALAWMDREVPAILKLCHGSQELGHALADLLFGVESPGGRLVQTWPRSLADLPPMMDYSLADRTYLYSPAEPLYPFGYGLSYTRFMHHDLRTSHAELAPGSPLEVSVAVTNSGPVSGDEVVQLYVRWLGSRRPRPRQALRGFQRVSVAPGATEIVRLPLAAEELASWDPPARRLTVEAGEIELVVGASSTDPGLRRRLEVRV